MKRLPALLGALLLAGTAAGAAAQEEGAPAPRRTRAYAGAGVLAAVPQGEFADSIDNGWGVSGHLIVPLDAAGALGIRIEGGFVNYGNERFRTPLSSSIGGRIRVNVNTGNNIFFLGLGPQLLAPTGRLRPYVNGTVGFGYFATQSSVEGSRDDEPFASTTNFDDWTLQLAGGAGLYVPLRRGPAPISLDLGARYHRNGRVRYLREGSIRDNPDGSISFTPIESEADFLTLQLGVSVALRDGPRRR